MSKAQGHHDIKAPEAVVQIADKLERAGHETWCVGGAVRDALLGQAHLDWDLATAATPDVVRKLFRRTVPVGIEFGTVGVFGSDGRMHEVTTFRRDVETDGRHARVVFGVSLQDDLARRDFTINAIAVHPATGRVFDPFSGRDDLVAGLVRTVGDADQRMVEDRLRALRGIRFAARFGFRIDDATWSAIQASAPHLTRLSAERVRQELEKTLDQVKRPGYALKLWRDSGAFTHLLPALASASDVELSYADYIGIPGAGVRSARRIDRMTAVFLPTSASGADLGRTLRDLRFSNSDLNWISAQVSAFRSHAPALESLLLQDSLGSGAFARRWVSAVGRTRARSLLRLCAAVWCARAQEGLDAPDGSRVRGAYRTIIRAAYTEPVELADLAVDGSDLLEAGVAAGPELGGILQDLLAIVLEDPAENKRDRLLQHAARLHAGRSGRAG